MGSLVSKPPPPPTLKFTPDLSKAQFSYDELNRQLAAAQSSAAASVSSSVASTRSYLIGWYTPIIWILGIAVLVSVGIVLYDTFAPCSMQNIFFEKKGCQQGPSGVAPPPATGGSTGSTGTHESFSNAAPKPPMLSGLYNSLVGSGSGNLSPGFHNASVPSTIQGNLAPLSASSDGGYGIQWWMYVKDWNYGYGKEKVILQRSDTTAGAVMNPKVSLHPTDNTMKVSISVFPATEGGSSKTQPAPAGHSTSTDDVFVCEVPNIPLQSWFSVSMTVFGRNLDIYIDGKLVKSCFLSGVPKPAVGNIQLTPDGGFSGNVCNLNHYSKMLSPSDASAFYSAGTPCKNQTDTPTSSAATGYSVKFGIYDAVGKEIQEYAF